MGKGQVLNNVFGTGTIFAQSNIWDINTIQEKDYYCISYNDSLAQKITVVAVFTKNSVLL